MGALRLLVVEGGAPAPVCTDVYEDWVRAPITNADLQARITALRAKAEAHRLPRLDPYGILRLADRSVNVSPTETDLLGCLIRRFGTTVTRETLAQCLPDRPGGISRNALDLHIMRLRRRIRPLNLVVRTVRGRGYLIETIEGDEQLPPVQRRARHTKPARRMTNPRRPDATGESAARPDEAQPKAPWPNWSKDLMKRAVS